MTMGELPPTAPPSTSRVVQFLVASVMAVLMVAYALIVFLTRATWADPAPQDRAVATFEARTPDGSPPSPDALAQAREVLGKRVKALGMHGAEITVDGDELTVAAMGGGDALRGVGEIGQLYMRPVIHAMPAQSSTTAGGPPPPSLDPNATLAQRISDEKQLRQSTDQSIQVLGLQFQATRCNDQDVLADNDDPNLPLVTCSEDHTQVYLLDKSIISGDQITDSTAKFDEQNDRGTVEVTFDDAGAKTFAKFTDANIGTQVAYTVDTLVVSAPQIQETIPGGRVSIAGLFTPASARDLAATLGGGALPFALSLESSKTEKVSMEVGWTPHRIGLLVSGIGLVLVVIGGTVYLIRGFRRR